MRDPRVTTFTKTICDAIDIADDDIVLIMCTEAAAPLIIELQREILLRGAFPEIRLSLEQMRYILLKYGQEKHLRHFPLGLSKEIDLATKLIAIESTTNPQQVSRIDQNRLNLWNQTVEPYHMKLDFIPTVVTIFPNNYYAEKANMSTEEYDDLFYKAVSVDLQELYEKYAPIENKLSGGNTFNVTTENTNLTFQLGERNFTLHSLLINLPNGELFCSPLEDSVEGEIRFESSVSYYGKTFPDLYLKFTKGVVTDFRTEGNTKELEKLLNTDPGARKIGKFGIGINPAISELTNDILFDEKLAGTCNFSLGDAYPEVGGTNRSAIHFDLVKDMRSGGQITMDGQLIYENGCFLQ